MKIFALFLILAAVVLAASPSIPCVVTQVDRPFFASGEEVRIYTASGHSSCPASPVIEEREGGLVFFNEIWFSLEGWDYQRASWKQVGEQWPARFLTGSEKRELATMPLRLVDGRYRLISKQAVDGGRFLEAVHFTVGAVENSGAPIPENSRLPYVRPAAVAVNGKLFFRGYLGSAAGVATGYLYQDHGTGTRMEILPVVFYEVGMWDDNSFVNQPWNRGGMLDLPWVRVELPPNTLDSSRPVYASITADDGGPTINAVVYDPTDPAKHFLGFSTR